MNHVTQIPFPPESQLHPLLAGAYYHDAFTAELADPALTPIEMMVRFGAAFPAWGEALMSLRNGVVKHLGIRDVGAFRKFDPNPPKSSIPVVSSFSSPNSCRKVTGSVPSGK